MSQASFDFPLRPARVPGTWRLPAVTPAHRLAWARAASTWTSRHAAAKPSAAQALASTGFEIGRDHAHHGLVPPESYRVDGHPVRAGWEIGRACFGLRTRQPTPAVRAWLALRLQAWEAGVEFDACHVTPHLMERLHPSRCPITRETLPTLGQAGCGQIDRMREAAAFEPGNLVTLSARAIEARRGVSFRDAIAVVDELELRRLPEHRGLAAGPWARLAVLQSFVTPLPHGEAARLPLLLVPPPRVPVCNPAQALQVVLTTQLTMPGYARRLAEMAGGVASARARQALQVFVHTLLARRVALGPVDGPVLREGLEDAWRHPLVNQRWQAFALQLTPTACERLATSAIQNRIEGGRPQLSVGGA